MARRSVDLDAVGHLLIICVVWGSSYLAVRICVSDGGFPPMVMGGIRMLLSAGILLGWARWKGMDLRLGAQDMMNLAVTGTILWFFGTGPATVAEIHVSSGTTAVIAATTPIWVAALECYVDSKRVSLILGISLLAGLLGVGMINSQGFGEHSQMMGAAAILFGAVCFAGGSVLQERMPVRAPAAVVAGYQQAFASVSFVCGAFARGETPVMPTGVEFWLSLAFLILFSNVIAFVSFIYASKRLSAGLVSVYAYVNPVIAVVLGWFILGEELHLGTLFGISLILVSVAGTFSSGSSGPPASGNHAGVKVAGRVSLVP